MSEREREAKGELDPHRGPWRWHRFGNHILLVTAHSGARVILTAASGEMRTRDPLSGLLEDLHGDEAILPIIAGSIALLEACERAIVDKSIDTGSQCGAEIVRIIRQMRQPA